MDKSLTNVVIPWFRGAGMEHNGDEAGLWIWPQRFWGGWGDWTGDVLGVSMLEGGVIF